MNGLAKPSEYRSPTPIEHDATRDYASYQSRRRNKMEAFSPQFRRSPASLKAASHPATGSISLSVKRKGASYAADISNATDIIRI